MPGQPNEITIAVEEDLPPSEGGAPRRLRLSATVRAPEGKEVASEVVVEAASRLRSRLEEVSRQVRAAEGGESGPRVERALADLLEEYRPKEPALVDALLWNGELTPTEHQVLRDAVAKQVAPSPPPAPPRKPVPASPSPPATKSEPSAVPPGRSAGPRGPPRPVEQLVQELNLRNLQEVNRARYQRVISFDEWSALKAHFERKG